MIPIEPFTIPLGKTQVLLLCGNSGCGKSTAVELLLKDLKVDVKVWSEDSWDAMPDNFYDQTRLFINRESSYSSYSSYNKSANSKERDFFHFTSDSKV